MINHSPKPKSGTFQSLRVSSAVPFNRAHVLLYSLAILALLYHRSISFISSPTVSFSFFASILLSELLLYFSWVTYQAFRWRPVLRNEYPERLVKAVDPKDFPALDVFICTADPRKEPPISVVSTALSVMAFDYPAEKLSVYLSDDGGSEVTLFAFMEAAKFARYWLPFCKENGLVDRSPEAYFGSHVKGEISEKMKIMYENMKEKVESSLEKGCVGKELVTSEDEREIFNKWTRHDHPSVIQVLLQSIKDTDIMGNKLPNLIYVSREKKPASPHHFKAGALNALVRVSSTMTDAPVILTLDCDMYSNDPQSPLRALCYFLDPGMASNLAFVQFPQRFHGINKNDIYASELKSLFTINSRGMDGLSGPNFVGTGCFFSRHALLGARSSPQVPGSNDPLPSEPVLNGSHIMTSSTCDVSTKSGSAISARTNNNSLSSESVLKSAHEMASCTFELDTKWGSTIGFRYGSLVEDFHTGYRLHCEGWKSVFCDPKRPAFLGDVPKSLNDLLSQQKRWIVGLYEVAFSKYSPITFGCANASLLTGLAYTYYAFWGIWCIPIMIYGVLPQLALIYQLPLFPKVSDPWFYLYAYLFLTAYGQGLVEFLVHDGTFQRWWNDQRMWMIRNSTSCLFGTIQYALSQIGVSAPGFNVTSKVTEIEQSERYEKGIFDFGAESSFFASLGTIAIVNLSSLLIGIARATRMEGYLDQMFVQLFLSGFIVANCWPIYEAIFLRKDGGRMQRNVITISFLLAGLLHCIGYVMLNV